MMGHSTKAQSSFETMMRGMIKPFCALLLLMWMAGAAALNIQGKVVAVMDGDTIEIVRSNKVYRLRLDGVDCPEKSQAYGAAAKKFTSDRCFGKQVTAKIREQDKYGRYLAKVILPGGKELNALLLRNGYAWHYKQYNKDAAYAALENQARKEKLGLWADKNPLAPWEFRHKKPDTPKLSSGKYVASQNSTVFHKPSCTQAQKIKAHNRRWFGTRSAAIKAGYKPCKLCKP